MDFYSNEYMARNEMQRRLTDLNRDAKQSIAARPANAEPTHSWSREFTAWVAQRADIGARFMARTPANP
ncbi:MAG: hypothetical protein WD904_08890 [Dehalococcoidia bacterium]